MTMSVHPLRTLPPIGSQWSDRRWPDRLFTVEGIIAPPAVYDPEQPEFAQAIERGKAYCRDSADGSLRLLALTSFTPAGRHGLVPVSPPAEEESAP